MNVEKINNSPKKLRILIAPLDWGLGHATRCIPIIRTLLKHNTEVLIAAKGAIKNLLEKEFPQVKIVALDGYNITYSRHKNYFFLKLLSQLPKVFSAIKNENTWLQKFVWDEKIDGIISDNRPGLHHANIPSVYITHQLQIQTGSKMCDAWMRKMHYKFINKFQQCWIPDNQTNGILGGALSHPKTFPTIPCKYIGILSRFELKETKKQHDFLLLLSGPEPQRTIFEKKLLQTFDTGQHSFVLVRGLPADEEIISLKNKNALVFNHLPATALNDLIAQSELIVARAGYSSIMDLARLHKKAVLVATPRQTEQEYLATYLEEHGIFASIKQEEVSFENIRQAAERSKHFNYHLDGILHEDVIVDWLSSLPVN